MVCLIRRLACPPWQILEVQGYDYSIVIQLIFELALEPSPPGRMSDGQENTTAEK